MKNKTLRSHLRRQTFKALFVGFVLALVALNVRAQGSTDGQTPIALAPGSPSGSYPLSDFENVNLFNGNLNFQMPLLSIGGRGGTTFPLTIHIDQKWTISKEVNPGHSAYYFGHSTWWSEDDGGNHTISAGRVRIRRGGSEDFYGPNCGDYRYRKTLTRITFIAPDGTEYELRDEGTHGQPMVPAACSTGFDRGRTFVTADGTAATFLSDDPIMDAYSFGEDQVAYPAKGYLMLKDGTRFRIDDDKVSWMCDRNGNKVTFAYDFYKRVTGVTDSLNRQITITYDNLSGSESYDQISFKGFGGAARTVKVGHGRATRSDLSTPSPLFPGLTGVDNSSPTEITYIELPDGRRYQIQYDAYSEIARIVMPTGGAIEYDWDKGLTDGDACGLLTISGDKYVYRRVVERRVYPDGGSGSGFESRMTYSRPESTTTNAGYVLVNQYNSSGTLLARSRHYFYGSARDSFGQKATDYPAWQDGKEYKTETFDTNGTTLLRKVENTFDQRAAVSWWSGDASLAPPNDVRPTQTVSTLADTNQVSKQILGYDDTVPFNNQNSVKEYDFGSGTAGALLRETRTTFVTDSSYTGTSVHLRSLPLQVSVYDGNGIERARATSEYDNYASDTNHSGLASRSGISGFDSSFSTAYTTRGNLTATTHYLLNNGSVTGSVSSFSQYDIAGNVVRAIDARGYATTIDYDDRFGAPDGEAQANSGASELSGLATYAFPTKVTNAANQVAYTQFDYYLGKPVNGEDINGVVFAGVYNDLLDRPSQVIRAFNNTTTKNQTSFVYNDTARTITATSDQATYGDNLLKSKTYYDLMGRTFESRQYEDGTNYIATKTEFDALGRAYRTSNPYRSGDPILWTTSAFDALGRATSVTTPDSAVVATSYSGNTVTVTDQTSKARKSVTDGLGRLTSVYEDPSGLNYQTSYAYDTLDNLVTVSQDSQTRSFVYDSLKRLTSATNPESGTISYQYDNNGNLAQKTDARGVTTAYVYDALNRNTSVGYSDGTIGIGRAYDQTINGKGRMSWEFRSNWTTEGSITGFNYDALGRVTNQVQKYLVNANWTAE